MFGVVCKALGLSLDLCDRVFLRIFLRDLVSAAVRLNLIGPMEGARMQVEAFQKMDTLLRGAHSGDETYTTSIPAQTRHSNVTSVAGSTGIVPKGGDAGKLEQAWCVGAVGFYHGHAPVQTAPIVDFLQSRHDLLYSRLFMS
jgi:urease accessory protein UreF